LKLIKTKYSIGILHGEGRIERVIELDAAFTTMHAGLADRLVASFNACEGISLKTLELLASGTGSGTVAERITAWSMYAGRARPTAQRIMEEAVKALAKQGDL